ncbi:MAG: hypothetical protein E7075_01835 [Bacteroidales bacterium]|nr:hypothetical protein [Bacteroidales bacterium]
MRVYRNNIETFQTSRYFPVYCTNGVCYASDRVTRSFLQPQVGLIVKTGSGFKSISANIEITNDSYYRFDGFQAGTNELIWTAIDEQIAMANSVISVIDIMKATYSGTDMGERKIVATIKFPTPIDFRMGDYVEIPMQTLLHSSESAAGSIGYERFYIYTEPITKKTARPMSAGDAFEITVTFYPRQYELGSTILRDNIQQKANPDNIIYTGFDTVSFVGGARALLDYCIASMNAQYVDNDGEPLWKYQLASSVDEQQNNALEYFSFSFSHTSVADALVKLNDPEQINTKFFINDRTIYVGYKRPYICKVNLQEQIEDEPLKLMYGKTSYLPINHDRGLLLNIQKTVGDVVPVTKLFAYGAARNINRYYCADLIASGRYVNKLMLPSFSNDGHTDFVISEDGVKKFGFREGSKEFDIYPSIEHMTYADIRGIKYCIKVKTSGITADLSNNDGSFEHSNTKSNYAVTRIQCYKVTPCDGTDGELGANKLVECAPPEDLVVIVRATGKVVKCVLRGGSTNDEAIAKQIASDGTWGNGNGRVPARTYKGTDYIPGSCFCVHDNNLTDGEGKKYSSSDRDNWFNTPATATTDSASELHRIEYVDTFWLTDVYVFESYSQTHFRRDGYSAGAWARINNNSGYGDSLPINEVVAVEKIVITDTSSNQNTTAQKTWDLYLRDLGFSIDEQNDFGDKVFVFDTPKISIRDGLLTGREFTFGSGIPTDHQDYCVCAYNEDGTLNDDFFSGSGYTDRTVAQEAFAKGAIWRLRMNRIGDDPELQSIGIILPNKELYVSEGDHVTLLDIYMPDVYVRAAENRLLREAMKYLRQNDKGDIKYATDIDEVRINQIPMYAIQMREGVRVRLSDEDLKITTENAVRNIVDYPNGLESQVSMFTVEHDVTTETVMTFFRFQPDVTDIWNQYDSFESHVKGFNEELGKCTISLPRISEMANVESLDIFYSKQGGGYSLDRSMATYTKISPKILTTTPAEDNWLISFECSKEIYDILVSDYRDIHVELYESIIGTETYKYSNYGKPYYAIANEIVEFLSGKYYEVVMDVETAFVTNPIQFLLSKDRDVLGNMYCPECRIIQTSGANKEGFQRIRVSFYLDNTFDDSVGYYTAVKYIADGNTEYASIRLLSVTEKDYDRMGDVVDYADSAIETITIEIEDNTRSADTRILSSYPEPIRKISLTLNNTPKATSWAKMMSRVSATEQEVETYKSIKESLIKTARDNARAILSLRNSIFDPDATTENKCDYTFLHIMMMQLGADSMNYLLDKTYQDAGGVLHNCSISRVSGEANPVFNVNTEDTLHHLVFTDGSQNGHWAVKGPFSQTLQPDEDGSWSPYFVCIRCRKDGANALDENAWICSKHQYAVNQDINPETGLTIDQYGNLMTDYWYFNWAILTCPDNDGSYVLRETRGNAYMYGDSLICGKISSLAQNSYFDLNTGNFVLGGNADGSAALSYINGVLTISGIPDENTIKQLIWEMNSNSDIGGENIVPDSDEMSVSPPMSYPISEFILNPHQDADNFISIKAGTYVFSAENAKCMWYAFKYGTNYSSHIPFNYYLKATYTDGTYNDITPVTTVQNSAIKDIVFTIEREAVISLVVSYSTSAIPEADHSIVEKVQITLTNVMLQRGNKSTSYQRYVKHLTDAFGVPTEIMGGVIATSLIMLRNEKGEVVAGMSGMTDNNPDGEYGDGTFSHGVHSWAGGSYDDALKQAMGLVDELSTLLPVLITKNGVGSNIGCFRVLSDTTVEIQSKNSGRIVIESGVNNNPSINFFNKSGDNILEITGDTLPGVTTSSKSISDYSFSLAKNLENGVIIGSVGLTAVSSYNVTYNGATHIKIKAIYIGLYAGSVNAFSSGFKLRFDIYLGERCICSVNENQDNYMTRDGGDFYFNLYATLSKSMTKINRGTYNITVRNVSVSMKGKDGGWYKTDMVRFEGITIGAGTSNATWADGNITFTSAGVKKITIGSNGMLIQAASGYLTEFRNDQTQNYIRMVGLPSSSAVDGRLYKDSDGKLCIAST